MGKRALVMSGGGARGAFELGAVDYLVKDRGLDFDVIAGVSVGSLNAVMLAQGLGHEGLVERVDVLERLWFGLNGDADIYRKRFLGQLLALLFKNSMYDPAPLKQKLEQHLDQDALATSGRQLRIGGVSLESGNYVPIHQLYDSIVDWTLASSSMPLAFPPVHVADRHVVDGGIRNITPLKDAFLALKDPIGRRQPEGRDQMYILLASPLRVANGAGAKWNSGRAIAARALEILLNEIFREDISHALAVNRSVRAFVATEKLLRERGVLDQGAQDMLQSFPFRPPNYKPVEIFAVAPDEEYMETLTFDRAQIRRAFDAGRDAAQLPMDEEDLAEELS